MAKKRSLPEGVLITTLSNTHDEFSEKLAEFAGQQIDITDVMDPGKFSSGEYDPRLQIYEQDHILKSVEGKTIYYVMIQGPFNDALNMVGRAGIAALAAKEHGAKKVIMIAPDLPFARADMGIQDCINLEEKLEKGEISQAQFDKGKANFKKIIGRPKSLRHVANTFYIDGVDSVLTMHPHSDEMYKIFAEAYGVAEGGKIVHAINPSFLVSHYLRTQSVLKERILENGGENLVCVSADSGIRPFVDRVRQHTYLPNISVLYCDKARLVANKADAIEIKIKGQSENFTTLNNKILFFADDMVDTGGTLIKTIRWLFGEQKEFGHNLGIPQDLIVYFTHPVLAGQSFLQRQKELAESRATEIIMTNTRPYITLERMDRKFKRKATVIEVASLFADAIHNCCEAGVHPDEYYKFGSWPELSKKVQSLYRLKKSTMHFSQRESYLSVEE